jgi:hypothetical protein
VGRTTSAGTGHAHLGRPAGPKAEATPVYELDNVSMNNLSASTLADLNAHLSEVELANGGTYSWQVTYNGDANNNSVTAGCGTVTPSSSSGSTATESTGKITQQ